MKQPTQSIKQAKNTKHPTVVNLDAMETPENSLYLHVRCFGIDWETTPAERLLLRIFNKKTLNEQEIKDAPQYAKEHLPQGEIRKFGNGYICTQAFSYLHAQIMEQAGLMLHFERFVKQWCNEHADKKDDEERNRLCDILQEHTQIVSGQLIEVVQLFQSNNVRLCCYPFPLRSALIVNSNVIETIERCRGNYAKLQDIQIKRDTEHFVFADKPSVSMRNTTNRQMMQKLKQY